MHVCEYSYLNLYENIFWYIILCIRQAGILIILFSGEVGTNYICK